MSGWPARRSGPGRSPSRWRRSTMSTSSPPARRSIPGAAFELSSAGNDGLRRARRLVRHLRLPGLDPRRAAVPRRLRQGASSPTSTTRCTSSSSSRAKTRERTAGGAAVAGATARAQRAAAPGRLHALRQREAAGFWLGQLAALGRVNPAPTTADESLRKPHRLSCPSASTTTRRCGRGPGDPRRRRGDRSDDSGCCCGAAASTTGSTRSR